MQINSNFNRLCAKSPSFTSIEPTIYTSRIFSGDDYYVDRHGNTHYGLELTLSRPVTSSIEAALESPKLRSVMQSANGQVVFQPGQIVTRIERVPNGMVDGLGIPCFDRHIYYKRGLGINVSLTPKNKFDWARNLVKKHLEACRFLPEELISTRNISLLTRQAISCLKGKRM